MENKIKIRLPKATNYELCCLDVINGIKWMGWMNEWMNEMEIYNKIFN